MAAKITHLFRSIAMYLMIENSGEADVRAFTLLGVSTARGESDKIGQFGSGAKLGLCCLLRFGINPIIYSGTTRFEFFTEPQFMDGKKYSQVYCKEGAKRRRELGFAAEFGEIDWTSADMGIREFVSNAIDASGYEGLGLRIVDDTRAKSGTTRVFLPLTQEVQQYFNNIDDYFLHFSGKQNYKLLPKREPGRARIYRKGVFVRTVGPVDSLYDYNFGEELRIDESRNLNDDACEKPSAMALGKDRNAIREIIHHASQNKDLWETQISSYKYMDEDMPLIREVFYSMYGEGSVIVSSEAEYNNVKNKGHNAVWIPSSYVYNLLTKAGVKKCDDVVRSKLERDGHVLQEASEGTIVTFHKVYKWLRELNLWDDTVEKPKLASFVQHPSGRRVKCYDIEDRVICINTSFDTDAKVMLRALSMYMLDSSNAVDSIDLLAAVSEKACEILFD